MMDTTLATETLMKPTGPGERALAQQVLELVREVRDLRAKIRELTLRVGPEVLEK